MTVTVRRITASATWTGGSSGTFANILSARASFGFDQRIGQASIVTPIFPTTLTYEDVVTLVMGAGTNNITRFVGLVRDFQYSLVPRGVETIMRGRLVKAEEYENYQDPTLVGGLTINDLLSGTPTGTAAAIVRAALTKASVSFTSGNIGSTSTVYGGVYDDAFIWRNGANDANPDVQDAGESALSYIERYDEVDADSGGGRYRTFETLGGVVYRYLAGGRPRNTTDFTFTETVDILDGHFERSILETRNYFLVTGYDPGDNLGAESYALQDSNTFQGSGTKHTKRFSSPMIERSLDADPGTGVSAQTVANALSHDYNREIVTGWITTHRDDALGIGQTHLVQAPGGAVDRLGVGERLWCQSLEISVDEQGFTQRMTYIGGGVDTTLPAPP
jgi:hypothetical protein